MLHQRTLDYAKSRSFELSPYQAEDACRLADQGTHFLFLDTGLGKTIVALAAIAELGKAADPKSASMLENLLDDPAEAVRRAARKALDAAAHP